MVNRGIELPPPCDFLPAAPSPPCSLTCCRHSAAYRAYPVTALNPTCDGLTTFHGPAICSQVHTSCKADVAAGIGRHGKLVARNFKVQLQPRASLDLCAPDSTRQHTARHVSDFRGAKGAGGAFSSGSTVSGRRSPVRLGRSHRDCESPLVPGPSHAGGTTPHCAAHWHAAARGPRLRVGASES